METVFEPEDDSTVDLDPYEDFNGAAFERLRWSVFDPAGIEAIGVVDNVENENPDVTPFATNQDLASQYVTKTLSRKIVFFVDALGEYESEWHDAYSFVDPHPEPERLEDCWDAMVVQREDNKPLTVGDVVTQLQAQFQRPFIRNRIREALAWMHNSGLAHLDGEGNTVIDHEGHSEPSVPEDVNILFDYIQPYSIEREKGYHRMAIFLWVEGEHGVDAEQFWKRGPI